MKQPIQELQAVVLKTWPYGDKDLIVSLMSEEKGKIRGIAKGARASKKRFAASLDLLCLSKFQIREKANTDLVFIEQAMLLNGYSALRSSYSKLMMSMGLLEMADFFSHDHHPEEGVFQLLIQSLQSLEKMTSYGKAQVLFWSTAFSYLRCHGLMPKLDECANCSVEKPVYYSLSKAQFFCASCKNESESVLLLLPAFMEYLLNLNLPDVKGELESELLETLSTLTEKHILYHFHEKPDWGIFLER